MVDLIKLALPVLQELSGEQNTQEEYSYAAWNRATLSASMDTFMSVAAVKTISVLSSPVRGTPMPRVRSLADLSSRRSVNSVSWQCIQPFSATVTLKVHAHLARIEQQCLRTGYRPYHPQAAAASEGALAHQSWKSEGCN